MLVSPNLGVGLQNPVRDKVVEYEAQSKQAVPSISLSPSRATNAIDRNTVLSTFRPKPRGTLG